MIGSTIPQLQRLSAAARAVESLAAMLPRVETASVDHPGAPKTIPNSIRFEQVEFEYGHSSEVTVVGPFTFEIQTSRLVLIAGRNGAGKTTLVKLLTGLYVPTRGRILVDGQAVNAQSYRSYRELFSAIYVDDFLLRDNVRLHAASQELVDRMLFDMELERKVRFVGGRFSTQQLSSGQRKRLALIEAMIEPTSFLVCDEWDDTQDASFRAKFFHDIVPKLTAAGKAVIVVSHNPQYAECADVVIEVRGRGDVGAAKQAG
jgi:putative ATP-binding cassette transporter